MLSLDTLKSKNFLTQLSGPFVRNQMLTFIRFKAPKVNVIVNMSVIQEKQTRHAFKSGLALEKEQKSKHQAAPLATLRN